MRPLPCALLVAACATAILIGRAQADRPEPPEAETPVIVPAEARREPAALYATVVKPFGASIRVAPALDAAGLYNAPCGTVLLATSVESGWVKVQTSVGAGWIGSGRVTVGDGPAATDCVDKRFLAATGDAWTLVETGCLSLRQRPSPESSSLACVGNGHQFTVVDGPFDPGSGDDWFKVTSPTTGTGWIPADRLYPY
jgi:hypothetical protein